PPSRSRDSHNVTCTPCRDNPSAHANPAKPPPTMSTRSSVGRAGMTEKFFAYRGETTSIARDQSLVFRVFSDPEPDEIDTVSDCQRAVMETDTHRPEPSDFLKDPRNNK